MQSFSAGPFAKSPPANRPNYYCEGWVYSEANPDPIIWHNGDNSFNHVAIGLIPTQPLERYAGKFNNPVYGDLLVESDGHKLWMTIGPRKLKMELIHWNHDSFVVSPPATDALLGDSGSATFSFAKDGEVSVITWDGLNDVNDGRFVVVTPTQ